jgi:hypothetical protein
MSLRLEPLSSGQAAKWDSLIAEFPQRQVFHRQAWFNCLAETQNAEWRYWAVTDRGRNVGYFSGGIIERGPFRILGSPLRTWHTTNLGPLLEQGVDGQAFVRALDDLAREERLSMIEIEYPSMPHQAFEEAGFSCHQTWTHRLPLSPDPREMMGRITRGRKYGIRKAQRSGLEVIECDDAALLLYDQLSRALQTKGAACPFPASFPQAIVSHLKPLGLLFTLGVRNCAGEIIAAGLFPADNGVVYLWDCSSELEGREFHPNDLLHWGLMCRAAEQGMSTYDMSGYGRFNKAFGAQLVATHRWNKCYSTVARCARDVYEQILKIERRSSGLSRLFNTFYPTKTAGS